MRPTYQPIQINILEDLLLLKNNIEQFLIAWGIYTGPISPGIILRLIKAHLEDVLMPTVGNERVVQVLHSAFPEWYVTNLRVRLEDLQRNPLIENHRLATRTLHQDYLETILYSIEQRVLKENPLQNHIWEVVFGPYGVTLLIPVNAYGQEHKPSKPKILCSHAPQDYFGRRTQLQVYEVPASLEDDELDPNQFILTEQAKTPKYLSQRAPLVNRQQNEFPATLLKLIDEAIQSRKDHVESRYHSTANVQRLPHGFKRV